MADTLNRPLALVILDGWGVSDPGEQNAVTQAHTPHFEILRASFPSTKLAASGLSVGLEAGVPGNPEVGHQCLGTGRAASADVSRVEQAIKSGQFKANSVLRSAFEKAANSGATVHLIGLLSDGGKHSTSETLYALLRMARDLKARDVAVHAILDGVDVPQRTADIFIEALEIKMGDIGVGRIASLCGRYFGMDARGNWERTARVYTMLVHAEGERAADAIGSVRNSFLRGIADEFVAPVVIENEPGRPSATVKDGDLVIYFNHRPETMRQLVRSLSVPDSAGTRKPMIDSICLTEYDASFELPVAFPAEALSSSLTEILARAGVWNVKVTQTERFPHLTYFFNGGAESRSSREQNILLPTPRGESLEITPESQSFRIADKALRAIESGSGGFYVINLPSASLAAKTGRIDKTIESIQYVDTCMGGIVEKVNALGGTVLITSSHARCDRIMTSDEQAAGQPVEQFVPFVLVSNSFRGVKLPEAAALSDVAPTVLRMLDISIPREMTGSALV